MEFLESSMKLSNQVYQQKIEYFAVFYCNPDFKLGSHLFN